MTLITSRHFKEAEFNRCSPSCSLQDMDQKFMSMLDTLRDEAGIPLIITSAFRPVSWEKAKGRSGDGDHPNRKGIDIRCNNSATRFKIVSAALKLGFPRIGIANSFIHVGITVHKAQQIIWTY